MHEALRTLEPLTKLRSPVFLAAFSGFTDASGAASQAIDHLIETWDARPVAEIDPQGFYDFTVQRPRVRLENGERIVDWPENRFYVAQSAQADRDFVLFRGVEPHLKWQTFSGIIEEVLREVGCETSDTVGAQPGGVPHTRPLPVTLSASHSEFEKLFGLEAPSSRYQGQTGIVGVLNLHLRAIGWKNASLWALTPHYLTIGPNPNVGIAVIRLVDSAFGTSTSLAGLEEAAREFEDQVQQVLEESSEASAYVRQLEEQYDANRPALPTVEEQELPATEDILSDLEQFLRRQRDDQDPD
jgi:predicted ATP-grasp superfamily ATP-dependent carboligase